MDHLHDSVHEIGEIHPDDKLYWHWKFARWLCGGCCWHADIGASDAGDSLASDITLAKAFEDIDAGRRRPSGEPVWEKMR